MLNSIISTIEKQFTWATTLDAVSLNLSAQYTQCDDVIYTANSKMCKLNSGVHSVQTNQPLFCLVSVFNKIIFCVFDHLFRAEGGQRETTQRNALFLERFVLYMTEKRFNFIVLLRFIRLANALHFASQNDITLLHLHLHLPLPLCVYTFSLFSTTSHAENMHKMHFGLKISV